MHNHPRSLVALLLSAALLLAFTPGLVRLGPPVLGAQEEVDPTPVIIISADDGTVSDRDTASTAVPNNDAVIVIGSDPTDETLPPDSGDAPDPNDSLGDETTTIEPKQDETVEPGRTDGAVTSNSDTTQEVEGDTTDERGNRKQTAEEGRADGSGISSLIESGATAGGGGQYLQPYLFTFEPLAGIPENAYAEPMIVKVVSGSFVLRVGPEDLVVVDAQGSPIPVLDEVRGDPGFQETGYYVADDTGQPCVTLCALYPEESVLVVAGQTVYLPGMVTCFWCNIDSQQAQLEVFAVLSANVSPSDFSWVRLENISVAGGPVGPGAVRAFVPGFAFGCRARTGT